MQINIAKTGPENVFDLVNAANAGLTLDGTKVTLGTPVVRTPDANPHNTTITLTAIAEQGYTGTVDITLTRLGMGSGVVTPSYDFEITSGDAAAFKTQVATQLGLVESEIVIVGTLPTEGNSGTVTVAGIADSVLYLPTTQTLNVDFPVPQEALTDAVATTEMDGFDPAV